MTILSIVLFAALAGTVVLIALSVRGNAPVRFAWGEATGAACPEGVGAPACFRFTVTNLGARPADLRCVTFAPNGARSRFLTDEVLYESLRPVEPGLSLELTVKVDPNAADQAPTPSLYCDEA
jgi:hypothetical protein